jgi:hypothetical protein
MEKKSREPFSVTREQIDDYQFTKRQIAAYNALVRATERCKASGLCLLSKQDSLVAVPRDMYMSHMTGTYDHNTDRRVEVPTLTGAYVTDSGADDTQYILDRYVKD